MPDTPGGVAYAVNFCQCGHDYVAHTNPGSQTTGTCRLCAAGNIHGFTSDNEIWPTVQFPQTPPARFFCTQFPNGTTGSTTVNHTGGYPTGTTVLLLAAGAGIIPGMTAFFNPGVPSRQSSALIVAVQGANIQLAAPGLTVAVANGDTVEFSAADGSMPGPALTPNGQRGG